MAAPGLGRIVYGKLHGDPDLAATGKRLFLAGSVLFVLGLVFFELVIGISGRRAPLRGVWLPILLIGVGIWVVVSGYLARRQRGYAPIWICACSNISLMSWGFDATSRACSTETTCRLTRSSRCMSKVCIP